MAREATEFRKIEQRERDLAEWLQINAPQCFSEQRHCEECSQERVYWHYGYLMALRDVASLLQGETTQDRRGNGDSAQPALPGERGSSAA